MCMCFVCAMGQSHMNVSMRRVTVLEWLESLVSLVLLVLASLLKAQTKELAPLVVSCLDNPWTNVQQPPLM